MTGHFFSNQKNFIRTDVRLFVLLWSILSLCTRNYTNYYFFADFTLLVFTLFFIWKPKSIIFFSVLITFEIVRNLLSFPDIGNSLFSQTIINIYLLITITLCKFNNKAFEDRYASHIKSDLRTYVMVLYFFATFQKLNIDYFSLERSCAVFIPEKIRFQFFPFLPSIPYQLNSLLIAGSLFMEGVAPIVLLHSRSQKAKTMAFYGLIVFHIILTPIFYGFNFLMLILLLQTVTEESARHAYIKLKEKIDRLPKHIIRVFVILVLGVFIFNRYYRFFFASEPILRILGNSIQSITMCIAVFAFAVGILKNTKFELAKKVSITGLILILTLTLNSFGPYFGFKSVSVLAMFSNLRMEFQPNHLIMTNKFKIFDEMGDFVVLRKEVCPLLDKDFKFDFKHNCVGLVSIPKFELGRRAYKRFQEALPNYESYIVTNENPNQLLSEAIDLYKNSTWWKKTFFVYRPLNSTTESFCAW